MAVKENIVIDVTVDTGDATNTIDGIENRIEELIAQRNELQIGTKEFEKVSREIQGLQTDIKNVELQFESLDFEQKLTAGMDAVTGLAGGFVAAEGAMLLFGTESEALEETLRRVGGALALTSGLRDLANGVIAMRKFGLATKLATARQYALNVAMNANPIGLIIALLAAVTVGVLAYAAATREVSKEERLATIRREELIEATKKANESIAEEKVELESLLIVAKDRNASDKARAEAVKQLNELSPEYLGALTTENVLTDEGTQLVNKYVEALEKRAMAEALQSKLVELQKQKIENLTASEEDLVGARDLSKLSLEELLDTDKALEKRREIAIQNAKEQNEAIDEQIGVLSQMLATSKEEELQLDSNTRAYDKQAEAIKKSKDERKALREEMEKEAQALKKIENAKTASINQMLGISNEAYQKEITNLRELNEALQRESEIRGESLRSVVGVQKEATDEVKEVWMTAWSEMAQMDIDNREAEKARIEEGWNSRLDKAQQGINFLGLINQAFIKDEEKREKIRKALAVAQIAVDTARGISAAVAAGAGVPFPYNIPAIISGVSAVLAGVIQAKAVIGSSDATPSVDSAISGASAGGGGVPLNNISNTASLVDQQQQEITTQVVVLESDITTTQENVTTVSELSSF